MIRSLSALVLGLVLGFGAGVYIGVSPWSAFGRASRVRVVNRSTTALTHIRLQIGSDEQILERLESGADAVFAVELASAVPLSIAFTCANIHRKFTVEAIEPIGDDRTITVLSEGQAVIVTHGSAASVVESIPVESTTHAPDHH